MDEIMCRLIGLAAAADQNGKSEHTDDIIASALLKNADTEEILSRIKEDKLAIAPNCATCASPCGNTADYDMNKFNEAGEDVQEAKERIVTCLEKLAVRWQQRNEAELPDVVYQALAYLSFDLKVDFYKKLEEDLSAW